MQGLTCIVTKTTATKVLRHKPPNTSAVPLPPTFNAKKKDETDTLHFLPGQDQLSSSSKLKPDQHCNMVIFKIGT
jgi:hypothetical protein